VATRLLQGRTVLSPCYSGGTRSSEELRPECEHEAERVDRREQDRHPLLDVREREVPPRILPLADRRPSADQYGDAGNRCSRRPTTLYLAVVQLAIRADDRPPGCGLPERGGDEQDQRPRRELSRMLLPKKPTSVRMALLSVRKNVFASPRRLLMRSAIST
jgi:hypothetical protein